MSDPINPDHYQHLPAKAIDIIMAAIAKAPSNQAAYLHGQTLKYLLRCWEKEGIEDLHKAKWYLDRLVGCDQLAEVAGAIPDLPINEPTANPADKQPPSDDPSEMLANLATLCSETKTDAVGLAMRIAVERFGGDDGVFNGAGFSSAIRKLSGVNCNLDGFVVAAILCGRSDVKALKGGSHYQYLRYGHSQRDEAEKPLSKQYREPTLADLTNGPIQCEYRGDCDAQWQNGLLVYILNGVMPYLCADEWAELSGQWAQCQIEVAE